MVTYPTGAEAQFWQPQNQQKHDRQKRSRGERKQGVFLKALEHGRGTSVNGLKDQDPSINASEH